MNIGVITLESILDFLSKNLVEDFNKLLWIFGVCTCL